MKLYAVPITIFEDMKSKIGKCCTTTSGQPCEELHGTESTLNDGSKIVLCHAIDVNGEDLIDSNKLSYPTNLETKADYLYVKDFFDKKAWLPDYQALLDNRLVWFNVGKLDTVETGITDELHEVRKIDEIYYQYEYKEDPDCKLFKMGFTVDEVEKIIAQS